MAGPRRRWATGAAALLGTALAVCLAGVASAGGNGGALFGKDYRSKSIVRDGERYELVDGGRVSVAFEARDDYDVVRWHAECNYFGARVRARERRLVIGRPEGTEIGCPPDQVRQDAWITRFFKRDPLWRRDGRNLNLISRSRDDAIRLRAR